ncbi:NADH:flavin oxidoreductase [Mesorhizobium sp.]|uniref:NADH:flavin oxidoreductase n=1 Tax=Mesorhizobium sp. TaxID=1871066 RepID=UPI00121E4BCD|nr:NADH:flavin oxidoreductase [Mesorhizobium sp.]TIS55670.1 MAG: N-methylproline demethylase [Mesorhizobium sp.]TIS86739.1 MAG: N-methylproline demethylase [Mesorhizobium sp.]
MNHLSAGQTSGTSVDPLLSPFRLKKLEFRNRVISTSHASMLDESGMPLERYQRYHEEKARGGLAMTMIGGSAMTSPDSSWGGGQLNLSTDEIIPHLQSLARRIHQHGVAVMSQVSHLGRRATAYAGNWLPAIAPSRIRETRNRNFPKEMDEADIRRIIRDYASAAVRCREGGLDGVETVTGGHLIGQFLSPRTNKRSDSYGGSVENRARFGLMVHEAIRKAVGDDMIVGIRFAIDEGTDEGSDFDDCLALARLFEREGHVDFFNCIYGRMDTDLVLAEHNMPGMFQRSAPFLPQVAQFRKETRLPLLHAAGIRDVATARHAIRENIVDLIGMTRAHIADPEIVNKILRGEEERIRPCVGATYCLYKKVNCIHNPVSGRETTLSSTIDRAASPKRVVVVGGGPAGLEAARVSAERGHFVIMFEAGAKLGGQILVAASAAERRDLLGIVDWRVNELERLGVDVRLNTYADADTVLAEDPDVVVVATGGIPDMDWLEGSELCDSVWDLLTGALPGKDDILIYDGTGRQAAPSCALHLARQGKGVCIVTPDDALAVEMPYPERASFRKLLSELGIRTMVDVKLTKVVRRGNGLTAIFRNELTGAETSLVTSQVVIENGTIPVEEVFQDLRAGSANGGLSGVFFQDSSHDSLSVGSPNSGKFSLHRIGDAVSSRDIYSSIYEAYRLCSRL